jgi:hypothetical protein
LGLLGHVLETRPGNISKVFVATGSGPAPAQWTGHGPEQVRRRSPSNGTRRAGTTATRSPAQRRIAESGVDRDPDSGVGIEARRSALLRPVSLERG